jgi:membrane protease subunit HflC
MNLYALLVLVLFLILSYIIISCKLRIRMIAIYFSIVVAIILLRSGIFIVNEGSQAVITQFGAIVGEPYTKAGLYFKVPMLWKVVFLDKRIYREAQLSARIPTKDGYFITVDEVFNWRISDPVVYIQTMSTLNQARMMIKNNISGAIRQEIAANDLLSIIRTNDKNTPITSYLTGSVLSMNGLGSSNLLGMKVHVAIGREELITRVERNVNQFMNQYGVEIKGVLLRSIRYDLQVEDSIYHRMSMHRLREAARLRASGRAQALYTEGLANLKVQQIIAPELQKALTIKGQAETDALVIQAQAYGKNADFYNYWRMLRVYQESLSKMSQGMVLTMDSPFLKWIKEGDAVGNQDDLPRAQLNRN